jgi:hypothetical protein
VRPFLPEEGLAERMLDRFNRNIGDDWVWPTNQVTYTAARLPHALLLSGRWMFNDEMIQVALRSLDWLWSVQSGPNDQFEPVGTEGYFPRGGSKARFAQLPVDACATIDACLEQAAHYHSAWNRCTEGAKGLHARNSLERLDPLRERWLCDARMWVKEWAHCRKQPGMCQQGRCSECSLRSVSGPRLQALGLLGRVWPLG